MDSMEALQVPLQISSIDEEEEEGKENGEEEEEDELPRF
jgi:hypothetical protein